MDLLGKGKLGKLAKGGAKVTDEMDGLAENANESMQDQNPEDYAQQQAQSRQQTPQAMPQQPIKANPSTVQMQKEMIDSSVINYDITKLNEEENNRKKEEILRQKLEILQKDEIRYTKYNALKVQEHWISILRKEKTEVLKKEIEILAQTQERRVDRKDAVVQMLYRDLGDSEEQHKMSENTQKQHLDELMDLHNKEIASLYEEFEKDLEILRRNFEEDASGIKQRFQEEEEYVDKMTKEMKNRQEKEKEDIGTLNKTKKSSVDSVYKDQQLNMERRMNEKIEKKKLEIKTEFEQHCKAMDAQYKDYKEKKKIDDQVTQEIKHQQMQIKMLEESLVHWKAKWLNNYREFEERNKKLLEEKSILNKHYTQLKKKMEAFRTGENERLKQLVKKSRDLKKQLEKQLEKATRIIKLSELSRKLETEVEKNPQEKIQDEDRNQTPLEGEDSSLVEKIPPEFSQLRNFYRKHNKVLLDVMALTQEKKHLIEENQKLRVMLKNYLDGISVNQDVLSKTNPLLCVLQIEHPNEVLQPQN